MNYKYENLYLTEKDTQAKILSPILNCEHTRDWFPCYSKDNSNVIVPLQGHVSVLAMPAAYDPAFKKWNEDTILCFPDKFKRGPAKGKEAIYNRAIEHIRQAKNIIIATDFDAEGAAMAMNIISAAEAEDRIEYMLHMGSMHPDSLKKALKEKPFIDYKALARAGQGRAEIDWAEGTSFSRALTLHLAKNKVKLNFGGLQSPIISMVVDRDLQFENHVESKYYTLDATAKIEDKAFSVSVYRHEKEEDAKTKKVKIIKNKKFDSKAVVEEIQKKIGEKGSFLVEEFTKRKAKENSSKFFTQSELQIVAGERLGLEPVQTLALAQEGYLKSSTNSYPRTETPYIALTEYSDVPTILANIRDLNMAPHLESHINNILSNPIPKRKEVFDFNKDKVTSHGAIIPTIADFKNVIPKLQDIKQKLFKIIAERYIENFMPPAISEKIKGKIHLFDDIYAEFTETRPLEAGFNYIRKPNYDDTIENFVPKIPTSVEKGSELSIRDFDIKEGVTSPKPRYTLTTLVKALEKVANLYPDDPVVQEMLKEEGIGTGSTKAPTIDGLFKPRSDDDEPWLVKEGKSIKSTPKARKFAKILPKEFISPIKRAYFQKDLAAVERGEIEEAEFHAKYKASIIENIAMIKEYGQDPKNIFVSANKREIVPLGNCPICGEGQIYEPSSKSKVYMCTKAAWKKEEKEGTEPVWRNEGCQYTIFKESLSKFGKKTIGKVDVKNLLKNKKFVATLISKADKPYKKEIVIDEKWGVQVDFKSNPK